MDYKDEVFKYSISYKFEYHVHIIERITSKIL